MQQVIEFIQARPYYILFISIKSLQSAVNAKVFSNKFHKLSCRRLHRPSTVKVLAIVMSELVACMRDNLTIVLGEQCI